MNTETSIAKIILQQLGGNRFLIMTGAHELIDTGNGLRMTIRRNKSRAKWLKITLTPDDLYHMEFSGVKNKDFHVFAEFDGVYFDMMKDIFESVTGYYTSM